NFFFSDIDYIFGTPDISPAHIRSFPFKPPPSWGFYPETQKIKPPSDFNQMAALPSQPSRK
ncbi:MAG: hypothetical protein WC572_03415, partial [Candidatus Omnitrophota bacterium]